MRRYALVAVASALLSVDTSGSSIALSGLLPTDEDIRVAIEAAVAAGARDGMSGPCAARARSQDGRTRAGENKASIDSLPMSESYRVLRELRAALGHAA